jgi:hypothetical protein
MCCLDGDLAPETAWDMIKRQLTRRVMNGTFHDAA